MGLTLEPGRRVLRGPTPSLLTLWRGLALLPTAAGKTPLQLPALALPGCVPLGRWPPSPVAVPISTNNHHPSADWGPGAPFTAFL